LQELQAIICDADQFAQGGTLRRVLKKMCAKRDIATPLRNSRVHRNPKRSNALHIPREWEHSLLRSAVKEI
jgi:hypothetical protein